MEERTQQQDLDTAEKHADSVAMDTDVADDAADKRDAQGGTDASEEGRAKKADVLKALNEYASEDDDMAGGGKTLRDILGGDILLKLALQHVWLILLVMGLTIVYVAFRYQCQQDVIEISRLEDELVKAKYRAMSSASNLTEMCRQGNVMQLNQDTLLKVSDQPPYIVEVPEN